MSSCAGKDQSRAVLVLRRPADVAVMQATDFGNRDDRAERRRLDRPSVGCILVEREVSAGPVIVREIAGQDAAQVPVAKDEDMIETSRRIEPIRRSAKGFCHGLCGAVRTSAMRMRFTRCRNGAP